MNPDRPIGRKAGGGGPTGARAVGPAVEFPGPTGDSTAAGKRKTTGDGSRRSSSLHRAEEEGYAALEKACLALFRVRLMPWSL